MGAWRCISFVDPPFGASAAAGVKKPRMRAEIRGLLPSVHSALGSSLGSLLVSRRSGVVNLSSGWSAAVPEEAVPSDLNGL